MKNKDIKESSILIVEDNVINRKLLMKGLSNDFESVQEVAGATRALKIAKQFTFDIFLLDIHMPIMNGLELAKIIKKTKKYESVPIIFITGSREKEEMRQGFEVGGVDFILKPYNMLEVVSKVKVHLDLANKNAQLKEYAEQMEDLAEIRAKQLVQMDRLAMLGTLSASIAHEINNPITCIASNIQILEKYWQYIDQLADQMLDQSGDRQIEFIREEMPKAFSDMKEGIKRVTNIAHKLKSFIHKPKTAIREEVEVKDIIDVTLSMAQPSLKNKVKIQIHHLVEGLKLNCNKEEIIQVILNLIINCVHALENIEEGQIEIKTESLGREIVIHIVDNGPGIPENLVAAVFEPFFTTKEKGKGSGLGLSISRDIMHAHGGEIEIVKKQESGAHFKLIFCSNEGEE